MSWGSRRLLSSSTRSPKYPSPQQVLVQYKEQHELFSLVVFIYLYTLLQAFAIPGPIFLCVICPALWGPVTAYLLCLCVPPFLHSVHVSVPACAIS